MRVWQEHEDCTTCYGKGYHHVLAEGADPDEYIPDYVEAYCKKCPAGKKRFLADGGNMEEWDA